MVTGSIGCQHKALIDIIRTRCLLISAVQMALGIVIILTILALAATQDQCNLPAPPRISYSAGPAKSPVIEQKCGEVGIACSGDMTFYQVGLGSCGWTNDGNTEKVFSLAHGTSRDAYQDDLTSNVSIVGMMEAKMIGLTNPNLNPNCGRFATISFNDRNIIAKLVDTCEKCVSDL